MKGSDKLVGVKAGLAKTLRGAGGATGAFPTVLSTVCYSPGPGTQPNFPDFILPSSLSNAVTDSHGQLAAHGSQLPIWRTRPALG